jgi:hypothetical protein
MADVLIPISNFKNGFTTCESLKDDNRLTQVPLQDKALGVSKVNSGSTHTVVKPPQPGGGNTTTTAEELSPPTEAWEALYPKGSINPSGKIRGGFGFYVAGPSSFAKQLEDKNTKEVLMSYRVMLQEDWEWVKGGKLPGFCK